jgi:hypothetical protein
MDPDLRQDDGQSGGVCIDINAIEKGPADRSAGPIVFACSALSGGCP